MLQQATLWTLEAVALLLPASMLLAFLYQLIGRVTAANPREESEPYIAIGPMAILFALLMYMAWSTAWPDISPRWLIVCLWIAGWVQGRGRYVAFYAFLFGSATIPPMSTVLAGAYPLELSAYPQLGPLLVASLFILVLSFAFRTSGSFLVSSPIAAAPAPDCGRSRLLQRKAMFAALLLVLSAGLQYLARFYPQIDSALAAQLTMGVLFGIVLAIVMEIMCYLEIWYQSKSARTRDVFSPHIVTTYAALFLGLVLMQGVAGQPIILLADVVLAGLIVVDPKLRLSPPPGIIAEKAEKPIATS